MLWEIEIAPAANQVDREAARVLSECHAFGLDSVKSIRSARCFLVEGELSEEDAQRAMRELLGDSVVENCRVMKPGSDKQNGEALLNVLLKPGVTDNVASSTKTALKELGLNVENVATARKYWFNGDSDQNELGRASSRVLANDAIEQVIAGPLQMDSIAVGSDYTFELKTVPIRNLSDDELNLLSKEGQLYLQPAEMQTIRAKFQELDRDPTDIELESIAQTWSEHCSHKTLAGRIKYVETQADGTENTTSFENMLKETIFNATVQIRERLGDDDWCVSVFADNAGIIKFDDEQNVCFKVETHNHPSALEPYGGANTGIGGVIRDPLGTGLGAKPICNTDVFCFAPPETPYEDLPPGTLHPRVVAKGVVAGVRDYGNRMGIPTVNGSVFFDERYLGNPLVYCGNVAMIPVDKCFGNQQPGDLIVAVGGRTGRDGIHGATFSSAELTQESEHLSGGAVQIGNAITEKMVADVILEARDRELYSAITDCGAGGFSSAVGEMGEKLGAEVWLDKCPLKYDGLSYTEIWISEAQERMVLAVPEGNWDAFHKLCTDEGVEATVIGKFTDTKRLSLKYGDNEVGNLSMEFLHDGRPPVIRDATFAVQPTAPLNAPEKDDYTEDVLKILGSLNVASKEWIIRQYDHEVQAGSVVKPLVGVNNDGPSDAAVVRPNLNSNRGIVVSNGMNPMYGDLDPYWMAASAIDEAIRNAVAVGADPNQIAILDNFCWGNTERAETLGTLVRAATACHDMAVAYGTPFISGKDSLNNEFSYEENGAKKTVAIPSTLLISALGQIPDVEKAVTMDLKEAGNVLMIAGVTRNELGGSHYAFVNGLGGINERRTDPTAELTGQVPTVDPAAAVALYRATHECMQQGLIRSCHDLSEGGLAVAIAEMSFAGGLGVEVNLANIPVEGDCNALVRLFSESNSRFVFEVEPGNVEAVKTAFGDVPVAEIGSVIAGDSVVVAAAGSNVTGSKSCEMKARWQAPLAWD